MERNIYRMIENPLDRPTFIDELMTSYESTHSVYSALTKAFRKQKISSKYNIKDCSDFYRRIYLDWKKSLKILEEKGYVKEEYKRKLHILNNYLSTQNPTTKEELLKLTFGAGINNDELKEALEDFRWNKIGEYTGWEHIHSNFVNYGLSKKQKVEHRLYINCDSTVTHRIIRRFIEKCREQRSSYYFKFDDFGDRDDNIVIYSDTGHLKKYIEILREIIKEEHLEKSIHKPPLATGRIDGWIGYGTEPERENSSFNEIRSEHIEYCINKTSYEWMMRNLNTTFLYNHERITYKEYLIRKLIQETITYHSKYLGDSPEAKRLRGYGKEDLSSQEMKNRVRRYIEYYFQDILLSLKDKSKNLDIKIPIKEKKISFNQAILEEVRKKQILFMYHNSKRFGKDLLEEIKSSARNFGIDSESYACDLYRVKDLKPTEYIPKEPAKVNTTSKRGMMVYHAMTDEEIEESRKKIGI